MSPGDRGEPNTDCIVIRATAISTVFHESQKKTTENGTILKAAEADGRIRRQGPDSLSARIPCHHQQTACERRTYRNYCWNRTS